MENLAKARLNIDAEGYVERSTWKRIGPGGGGAQFIPTVSPHDPNTAIVACDMTCSFITYDGGKSWNQFNLGRLALHSATFDAKTPGVVYAGSTALFRSEDNGDRWKLIYPKHTSDIRERIYSYSERFQDQWMDPDEAKIELISDDGWPGGYVEAIATDIEQSEVLCIATLTDKLNIMVSTDYGENWRRLCTLDGQKCYKVFIDPASPKGNRRILVFGSGGIYMQQLRDTRVVKISTPSGVEQIYHGSCGINPENGKPVLFITTESAWSNGEFRSGIFRSYDYGETWQELNSSLGQDLAYEEGISPAQFNLIAPCENDARVLYLSVQKHRESVHKNGVEEGDSSIINYYGIMKSEDMGESWRWVLHMHDDEHPENKGICWVDRTYGPEWGEFPLGLGVCSANPDVCYVTDLGITYKTADGGATWQPLCSDELDDGTSISRGTDVTTCYFVHFDPFDKNHMAISYTDIGLFHSLNGGKSWVHSHTGVPRAWWNTCYDVEFDPDIKGKAWSVWANGHDLPRIKMILMDKQRQLRFRGGVCRTEDSMANWTKSNTGLPDDSLCTSIVLDPESKPGNRTLYVTVFGQGVYKSVDDGYTWFKSNKGLGENLNTWSIIRIPDGTLYLLIARGFENGTTTPGELYRSTDGAESWEKVSVPEGAGFPNDLAFDPNDTNVMYMAYWPDISTKTPVNGGIYKTEDRGQSWRKVFGENQYMYGVAVDPENPSTIFGVSMDSGAYRSDDGGKTWRRLKGFNFKWGSRPILDPYNKDMMYITTFGNSVSYGPREGMKD